MYEMAWWEPTWAGRLHLIVPYCLHRPLHTHYFLLVAQTTWVRYHRCLLSLLWRIANLEAVLSTRLPDESQFGLAGITTINHNFMSKAANKLTNGFWWPDVIVHDCVEVYQHDPDGLLSWKRCYVLDDLMRANLSWRAAPNCTILS